MIKLSLPNVLAMFFEMFSEVINAYYVGHFNDTVLLGGYGIGCMLQNIFIFAIFNGMNGAIETLVSISFGREDYRSCGLHL